MTVSPTARFDDYLGFLELSLADVFSGDWLTPTNGQLYNLADPKVAVGETCYSAAPPSPFSRCCNRDGEGVSAQSQSRQWQPEGLGGRGRDGRRPTQGGRVRRAGDSGGVQATGGFLREGEAEESHGQAGEAPREVLALCQEWSDWVLCVCVCMCARVVVVINDKRDCVFQSSFVTGRRTHHVESESLFSPIAV